MCYSIAALRDWLNTHMPFKPKPIQAKPIQVRIDDCQLQQLAQMIADTISQTITKELEPMSQAIDDLSAVVAANSDVVSSAITLISGLADEVAAAGTDPQALADLTTQLKASAQALADAVAANTPVDPAAPPAP